MCNNFTAGKNLFIPGKVEVGRGGCKGPNSNVYIGDNVGIFEGTIINPSDEVYIGDNVGIGGEVMIWTHGAWLDIMQGFPADFGPVKIGNNVWLPARSIVLPNVEIGDNTVIGIGSIVNKSIPSGSLAAGSPCKIIKENYYPRTISNKEKLNILKNIVQDYIKLAKFKNIKIKLKISNNNLILSRYVNVLDGIAFTNKDTIFNLDKKTLQGYEDEFSEDLRDYLRRKGIKIFTHNKFKSI
jgi:acetyltransferase-like isoleucine patch superfamily enzyme